MNGTEADPESALLVADPVEHERRRTFIESGTTADIELLNARLDVLAR